MTGILLASERWPLSAEEESSPLATSPTLRFTKNASLRSAHPGNHGHSRRRFWAVGALLASLAVIFFLSYCHLRLVSSMESTLEKRNLASGGESDDQQATASKRSELCGGSGRGMSQEQASSPAGLPQPSYVASDAGILAEGKRPRKRKRSHKDEEDDGPPENRTTFSVDEAALEGTLGMFPPSKTLSSVVSSPLPDSQGVIDQQCDRLQQAESVKDSPYPIDFFVDETERSSEDEASGFSESMVEFYIQEALEAEEQLMLDPWLFDVDSAPLSSPPPGNSQYLEKGSGTKRSGQEDHSPQVPLDASEALRSERHNPSESPSSDHGSLRLRLMAPVSLVVQERRKSQRLRVGRIILYRQGALYIKDPQLIVVVSFCADLSASPARSTAATSTQPSGPSATVAERLQHEEFDEKSGDLPFPLPDATKFTSAEVFSQLWDDELESFVGQALQTDGAALLESWLLDPDAEVPSSPSGVDEDDAVEGPKVQAGITVPSALPVPPPSTGLEVFSSGFGAAGTHKEHEGTAMLARSLQPRETDYAHHPFFGLPAVLPSVDRSALWKSARQEPDAKDSWPILKAIRDILAKPILNFRDLELLQAHGNALRRHVTEHVLKPISAMWPFKLAQKLALRLLIADALWCTCAVVGPSMLKETWWPKLMNKLLATSQSFSLSLLRTRQTSRLEFALQLLDALEQYKAGGRPCAQEVVQIKRKIFCEDQGMPFFQDPRWDAWRKADQYYKHFGAEK
ncbi:hypothetical protein Esti_006793 [Eimeria stiedai]